MGSLYRIVYYSLKTSSIIIINNNFVRILPCLTTSVLMIPFVPYFSFSILPTFSSLWCRLCTTVTNLSCMPLTSIDLHIFCLCMLSKTFSKSTVHTKSFLFTTTTYKNNSCRTNYYRLNCLQLLWQLIVQRIHITEPNTNPYRDYTMKHFSSWSQHTHKLVKTTDYRVFNQ